MSDEQVTTPVRRAVAVRTVLARTGSALVVLALAATATVLGERVPPYRPTSAGAAQVAVPASGATSVCPGPLRVPTELEPGEDAAYDPEFDPTPGETASSLVVAADGADASLGVLGAPAEQARRVDVPVLTVRDPAAVHVLTVAPGAEGEAPEPASAVVGARTVEGDLRGLAAAACQAPLPEAWLVGGGTTLGASTRLVLANPGRTAATVTVDVWGATGAVDDAGTLQYLVPPGAERAVLLEGVAAEEARTVLRVRSSGGLVAAYLQVSELRGLTPAGVDLVVPGGAPSTRQVVPGVAVLEAAPGTADAAHLRLLAPDADARVSVRLLGPDGEIALGGADGLPLVAGEVLDLPLTGVPTGTWTAVVEADVPVVAGALVTFGEGVGRSEAEAEALPLDVAWAPAVRATGATTLALPEAGRPLLTVGATGGPVTVPVSVVMPDGSVEELEPLRVAAGSTRTLNLRTDDGVDPVSIRVGGPDGLPDDVVWGVLLRDQPADGGLVSVVVPTPRSEAPGEVAVVVG